MKLIAREPTAEMSAVGGQYLGILGIGMLGDYELAARIWRFMWDAAPSDLSREADQVFSCGYMVKDDDGNYVLFADHDTEIARLRAEVDYLRELLREARDSVNEELNHAEINRRQESIDYSRDLLAKIDTAIVKEN